MQTILTSNIQFSRTNRHWSEAQCPIKFCKAKTNSFSLNSNNNSPKLRIISSFNNTINSLASYLHHTIIKAVHKPDSVIKSSDRPNSNIVGCYHRSRQKHLSGYQISLVNNSLNHLNKSNMMMFQGKIQGKVILKFNSPTQGWIRRKTVPNNSQIFKFNHTAFKKITKTHRDKNHKMQGIIMTPPTSSMTSNLSWHPQH